VLPRGLPDIQGVQNVTEVQESGRGGSEPGDDGHAVILAVADESRVDTIILPVRPATTLVTPTLAHASAFAPLCVRMRFAPTANDDALPIWRGARAIAARRRCVPHA